MKKRRILIFSTDEFGPGTICGGIRIIDGALRRIPDLCVLAMTDSDGVGVVGPTDRFDHVRLPDRAGPGDDTTARLRSSVIRTVLGSFRPDLVVALRSVGSVDHELLEPLVRERAQRPELETVLALWDVSTDREIETLETDPDGLTDLFDETWSFGDPTVHDHRRDLPPALAGGVVDLGYATDPPELAEPEQAPPLAPPRISISLGTGWLAADAVEVLYAALQRPGLQPFVRELIPNKLLGQAACRRIAHRLGVGLAAGDDEADGSARRLVVSTGGYNSVCAALSSSVTPVFVHDHRRSTARLRTRALAAEGLCSTIDLAAREPDQVEAELLEAFDRPPCSPGIRTGGVAAAATRLGAMLDRDRTGSSLTRGAR